MIVRFYLKLATAFLVVLYGSNANAQIVNIPDENFKNALFNLGVDLDNDGEIQISEAAAITELPLPEASISNINGINAFVNLKRLDLYRNDIDSFYNVLLPELEYLNLRSNLSQEYLALDGMPNLRFLDTRSNYQIKELSFENTPLLDSLSMWNNSIENIDLSPLTNLRYVDVGNMELTTLDVSGNLALTHLRCNNNMLTSLDLSANTALQNIACFRNQLETLVLPQSTELKLLDCGTNMLTALDLSGSPNIIEFECNGNLLTSLDVSLLSKLTKLFSFDNQLTEIIFGSHPELESINIFDNQLSELNIQDSTSIMYLNIDRNQFTSFDPNKYPNLTGIHVEGNQLTEIDLSRKNINWINVSDNLLTEIDVSNNGDLVLLHCGDNIHLEYINLKNGGSGSLVNNFWFSGNENLKHICVDDSRLTKISEKVENVGLEMCTVSTYCDFVPGGDINIFKGTVLFDNDDNACSSGAIPLEYQQFEIPIGLYSVSQHISDGTGSVLIPLSNGNYTIRPKLPNSELYNINPDSVNLSYPTDSSYLEQNFCVSPIEYLDDVSVYVFALEDAIPGFSTEYKIKISNQGTTFKTGEVNFYFDSKLMSVVSSSETYVEEDGILTWQYEDLSPFKSLDITVLIRMNTPMDTPSLNGGDELRFSVDVLPLENDITPENNTFMFDQIVVNSYDPNDKTCLQGGVVMDSMLGTYLDYLIRFENLGTANAQNVVVKDQLSGFSFDVGSLEVTDASHPMYTRVNSNTVEFVFEDIQLSYQDSINDGYVAFRVKTNPQWLQVGDTIKNNAEIYFDFNFPIITNTYKTIVATDQDMDGYNSVIDCDDSNASINPGAEEIVNNGIDEDCDGLDFISGIEAEIIEIINVYPNPTSSTIQLSQEVDKIEIYNLFGEKLYSQNNTQEADISAYPKGVYLVKIEFLENHISKKVIKQ